MFETFSFVRAITLQWSGQGGFDVNVMTGVGNEKCIRSSIFLSLIVFVNAEFLPQWHSAPNY